MWWLGRSEDDGVWLSLCDGVCQLRGAYPNIRQVHDLHVLAKDAPQLGGATLKEKRGWRCRNGTDMKRLGLRSLRCAATLDGL